MVPVEEILSHWGIQNAKGLKRFEVGGGRLVFQAQTEIGTVILKGQPAHVKENVIYGNIHAHEFLGNLHHMAPCLYYTPDGAAFWKGENHYFYVMEFIEGRQAQETVKDERLLGEAAARLHLLRGYREPSLFNVTATIERVGQWFGDYPWKKAFDEIVASLPDFSKYEQCFIHTDIGPHNAVIRDDTAVFIDLDDAGLGCRYIDLGWPFIMQFVDYNKQTHQMRYRFDLAKAFLEGYAGISKITRPQYDLLWKGAVFMHISYMKCYGTEAEQSLWDILTFGMAQKEALFSLVYGAV